MKTVIGTSPEDDKKQAKVKVCLSCPLWLKKKNWEQAPSAIANGMYKDFGITQWKKTPYPINEQ